MSQMPVLAYADYAVSLSGISLLLLAIHAMSLRQAGRKDRAWGWLTAALVILAIAHVPEVLVIAGVARVAAVSVWPILLALAWPVLLRFLASGRGILFRFAARPAFLGAFAVAGVALVIGVIPFGLATEAAAVLVSIGLLGVADSLRCLGEESSSAPTAARRSAVWVALFAVSYAASVILLQAGYLGPASVLAVARTVAVLIAAVDFGGYMLDMAQADLSASMGEPRIVGRAMRVALLGTAVVIGFSITEYTGRLGVENELHMLHTDAAVVASALDSEEVAALNGEASDLGSHDYAVVASALTRVLEAQHDITYAYLMQKIDGEAVIIAEGDPVDDTPDIPGTVYDEASPGLLRALESNEPFSEGPLEDKWGVWYSSFAPVVDSETGQAVALLGLDMDERFVIARRAEYRLFGLALVLTGCAIVLGLYAALQMTRTASSLTASSERRFRRVFESAPEGILVLDANTHHVVNVNPFAEELLGYTGDQLASMRLEDLCAHRQAEPCDLFELATSGSDTAVAYEAAMRVADGRVIDVEATGVPIEYEGSPALMLFVHDIGDRKAARESLTMQAEFNALITDISRSFINVTSGTIDEEIKRALRRIGLFARVDRAYVFRFDDEDRMSNTHEWNDEGVPGRKTAFRNTPTTMYPTLTTRLMGGRDVYVPDVRTAGELSERERHALGAAGIRSLLVVPMTVTGYTVGFMGFDSIRSTKEWSAETISLLRIVADIVATAQARTRAQSQLRKLSRAIEQSPVAVIITDAKGDIEYVNPKFTQLTGYGLDEATGANPRILKSGITQADVYEDLWETVLAGEEWSGEFVNRRKDGTLYRGAATISAMRRDDGTVTHFVGVQEDVTAKREAEEALREAKAQAETANRAKSEFLATMSHEIRTPMNAIIGMAELLEDTGLSVQQARYVEIYKRAGESLLELINSVLDLSKIEADRLDVEQIAFDIREIAETAGAVVGMRAGDKGVELLYRVTSDVPAAVIGDPARLRQVLMNLLGNAVKFTEKGQVLLTVSRDPDRPGAGDLLFSVADTGIGIPKEKLGTVFESFTQADSSTTRRFGGTGLGLTISKRLVELMGGRMWVESTVGKGTTFLFTVPFNVAENVAENPTAELGASLSGLHVLIVDDNPANRLIVGEMMAPWGIDSTEAFDAEHGLRLARSAAQGGHAYDIVVLDHQMPGMDGFEFLETLRADESIATSAVVMLSSDAHGRDTERARRLGLVDYLLKPVRRGELRDALTLAATSGWRPVGEGKTPVEVAASSSAGKSGQEDPDKSYRVLLVEDTEDNRFLIRNYLSKTGHVLTEAVDGQEAIDAVMGATEPFDLVLMDMQMPVMDGYEATRRIRRWEAEHDLAPTCVLALTAYAMEEEIDRSLEAGCNGHLTKPIKKRALLEAIELYARGVTSDAH